MTDKLVGCIVLTKICIKLFCRVETTLLTLFGFKCFPMKIDKVNLNWLQRIFRIFDFFSITIQFKEIKRVNSISSPVEILENFTEGNSRNCRKKRENRESPILCFILQA